MYLNEEVGADLLEDSREYLNGERCQQLLYVLPGDRVDGLYVEPFEQFFSHFLPNLLLS